MFRVGAKFLRSAVVQKAAWSSTAANPKVIFNVPSGKSENYTPGSIYEGFQCTRCEHVPDFNMTAYYFQHQKTGSEYLHVERDDPNNVFSINFRTTPFDSTGLPHILEHNVLCGSKKFPVRDPFFKMLNRSLATFMNAMTGPDYTLYPFSSMNKIDFTNLQRIYLDAVFKPNLKYLDFKQEGWRLENSDLNDRSSPYVFKGVVYNEMKGAFSENASVFGQRFFNEILPDHTYKHVSGGEPLEIPKLTHEDLVNFHAKYYHPSNAKFYSYGNFPLTKQLRYINENYLHNVPAIDRGYSEIPSQTRWTQPKSMSVTCRYDNMGAPIEKQNQIAIGYLMSDITDSYETFLLYVLSELLVKGPNSYFYKSMIEPNFSGGFNSLTGYDSQIKDTMFVVGLQDLAKEDFGRVESIFQQTIDEAIEKGFKADHVDSILHNIELSMRHQTPKFGLGMLFNITPLWNHNGDVIRTMHVSKMMQQLKDNLANPRYLQERLEFYFRKNSHKLTMTMSPDLEYEKKFSDSEQVLLQEKIAQLSDEDKKRVYQEGLQLSEIQKKKEDLNVLPCLNLRDIKKSVDETDLNRIEINGVKTHVVKADTNGVTYFKGIINAQQLTHEQKLLLPLLIEVVDQFGTKKHSYQDFDNLIKTKTNGLFFRLHCSENIKDISQYELALEFNSFCLDKNVPDMFKLFEELFKEFKMEDVQRFEMLLENYMSNLTVGIANSGHLYAMQAANGLVTEAGQLKETLSGIGHINFMKNMLKSKNSEQILGELKEIALKLFDSPQLRCGLNLTESNRTPALKNYEKFLSTITASPSSDHWNSSKVLPSSCRHNLMTIPVNYCSKSFVAVPYVHEDFAPLRILAKLLSSKYLLPVVREQNGAYGAGAKINVDGNFNFFSYRDPHSRKTLDTFDNTHNWIKENLSTFDDQVLFEAKLGVLQQLDAPVAPGAKGDEDFKLGIHHEIFTTHRQRILNVTKNDLQKVGKRYFETEPKSGVGRCVIGPENKDLGKGNEKWTVSSDD